MHGMRRTMVSMMGVGLLWAASAWAQQGSNPTVSDLRANTAGGTITFSLPFGGQQNTAFGFGAMGNATSTSAYNTAVGVAALNRNGGTKTQRWG